MKDAIRVQIVKPKTYLLNNYPDFFFPQLLTAFQTVLNQIPKISFISQLQNKAE